MGEVLLAGIDTLAVGFNVDEYLLTPEDWAALADAKASAQGTMFDSGGQPIVFQGRTFSVSPKGSHGYEYVLVNDDITIQIAERATGGSHYPEVRVTWRSAYLWRYGWRGVYTYVKRWVRSWAAGADDAEKVSRSDLCIDVAASVPEVNLRVGEVVSYARSKSEFHVQHHLKGMADTGYTFGQGDLMGRVYDKLAEIVHSNKAWFQDLWRKNGWNGEDPVTRVEFQVRRAHLKSQQIDTVEDLERQLADLWKYFTDWVSLRDQDDNDSNRRRWPKKPFWETVRAAVPAFGVVTGVVRLTQRKPRIDALRRLGRGVLVSLAAMMATTYETTPGHAIPLEQATGALLEKTFFGWITEPEFPEDVRIRAARLAIMT